MRIEQWSDTLLIVINEKNNSKAWSCLWSNPQIGDEYPLDSSKELDNASEAIEQSIVDGIGACRCLASLELSVKAMNAGSIRWHGMKRVCWSCVISSTSSCKRRGSEGEAAEDTENRT